MSLTSENDFELSEALTRLISSMTRGSIIIEGIIVAVNADFTADVKIGDITHYDVPLRILVNAQASVYEIPVINSACLVSFRDGNINRPQIISVDQVDQLLINCKTLVQFNGGHLGGMVKVIDLVFRLNTIEGKLNDLISKYDIHTHTGVTTGGGVSGPTASQEKPVVLTKRSDIENNKIQQ